MLTDFNEMFSIFENLITSLVVNGNILQFNDKGDIISKASQLYTNQAEVTRITDSLRNEFAKLENTSKALPPVTYSIAKNEKRTFSIDDNLNDIVKASVSYNYTLILKQDDYDTQSLSSYRGIVCRLNREYKELTQKHQELQKEYDKVLKKKKQFQLVVLLAISILGCGVGLFLLNDNLKSTQEELSNANQAIYNKNERITELNGDIKDLNEKMDDEVIRREQVEESYNSFKNSISNTQPFFVKATSFDFDTGFLTFDYIGFTDEDFTIQVNAFGDDAYSNSSTIGIEEGNHSNSIFLSRDLDKTKWYSFELLIDNKIVGGDRH
jgi:cell division protein FtsL